MEIGRTLPVAGLGQAAAAWADTPVVGDASVEADNAPPPEPGQSASHGVENAGLQVIARAPTPVTELHKTDDLLPTATSADSDFAAPAALLVPATLVGLQVEAAAPWPMPWRGFDPTPQRIEREPERQPPPPPTDDEADPEPEAAAEQADDDQQPDATQALVEEPLETAWCEPLTRTLRSALAGRVPPQALLAAADQWKRGRCVVLACPQGHDAAGPAWAFVLWPRPQPRAIDGVAPPLALYGLQVDARLQWSSPPRRGQWCHVRVVKEHHPRTGRQLVSLDDAPARQPVPCEVQLGPVLARSLRWCEVCVRIQAAQRFWTALGAQWSVHVVVCAEPLIAPPPAAHGSPSC